MKISFVLIALLGFVAVSQAVPGVQSDLSELKDTLLQVGYSNRWHPTTVPGVPSYRYENGDVKCHILKGHCGTTCSNGARRSRRCGGGANRVCCVPDVGYVYPPDTGDRRCADRLGVCGHGTCAGGAIATGLCPGTSRCCINGLPGTQYSSVELAEKKNANLRGPYRDAYRFGPGLDQSVSTPESTQAPGPWRTGYVYPHNSNDNRNNLAGQWIGNAVGGTGRAASTIAQGLRTSLHNSNTQNHNGPKNWLDSVPGYTFEKLDRSTRRTFPQFRSPANKFLLHTIEGRWPSHGDYEGGTGTLDRKQYWPHFILARDRQGVIKIGQYLPLNVAGRALAAHNIEGAIQVEIGAKAGNPFTSEDREITDAVAALWCALNKASVGAIPLTVDSRVTFRNSQAYGKRASQRLPRNVFREVAGLVGHQHAPDNSHWDPGAIDAQALKSLAESKCRSR